MTEVAPMRGARRLAGRLKDLVPRPIGWSVEDQSGSRRKFLWIFGGIVTTSAAVALLGLLMLIHPERAGLFWTLQFALIVVLFGLISAALACARRCFFDPLTHVRDWASAIRQGNFAARVPATGDNDYAALADDINRLAEWLESLAHDMDTELRQQAEWLSQKSRSLQLLYDVASGINASTKIEELLGQFLHALHDVFGAYGGTAFLRAPDGSMRRVASVGLKSIAKPDSVQAARARRVDIAALDSGLLPDDVFAISIPLQYKDAMLGEYELYVDAQNRQLTSEAAAMLTSIGRQLGIAVRKSTLEQDATRLSRMEERTRLANELHDSLAQTLASLKFQVRILDDTLHQGDESAVWQCMEHVEGSLDEAYAELRELITHFRAPIDKRGIVPAIEATVSRFKKETDISIFFQNQWRSVVMSPEHGLQVVRIIQEALNNCRKHSKASAVRVLLSTLSDDSHQVLVEDDGAGFNAAAVGAEADEHLGLGIMRERAAKMDGELRIESEPGEGARVVLRFSDPKTPVAVEHRSVA